MEDSLLYMLSWGYLRQSRNTHGQRPRGHPRLARQLWMTTQSRLYPALHCPALHMHRIVSTSCMSVAQKDNFEIPAGCSWTSEDVHGTPLCGADHAGQQHPALTCAAVESPPDSSTL